jgi:DNA-binding CsgD family transcriptional regulator/methylmalonyl-CoA mutase cobalamin-binding subunit
MTTAAAVRRPSPSLIPDPSAEQAGPLLVCAAGIPPQEPLVVLADGTYETADERVFWRRDPETEVLRLPRDLPVAIRPLRRAAMSAQATPGEQALLDAVRANRKERRSGADLDLAPVTLEVQLREALEAADTTAAEALGRLLWREAGLPAVFTAISSCLRHLASTWADGSGSVLAEHRATRTAFEVAERLRPTTSPSTRCGTVVLAAPAGDRHTLALTALRHLLEESGRQVLLVDDLPVDELAELAADPGTVAVVVSAHLPLAAADARRLAASLRAAAPEVLLVLGGPGVDRSATSTGADLVTDDLDELSRALDERSSGLTSRERQVLLAVADGRTNAEIADALGIAPATVKTHMDHILSKTCAVHRAAAVARALRRGWIA